MASKKPTKTREYDQPVAETVPENASRPKGTRGSDGLMDTSSLCRAWAVDAENRYFPCRRAAEKLPAGQYVLQRSDRGVYFSEKLINLDDLVTFPDSASVRIIGQIEDFWSKEAKYREFGFLWKRGILLWGPPGSGKTTTIQVLCQKIVERDGVVIYVSDPRMAAEGLQEFRKIEPGRPLIVVLEDIDAMIRDYSEQDLLAVLDGEMQIDNVVYLATTNYIQKLDKRIACRPSRFDVVQKIGMPVAEARRAFLMAKNPYLAARAAEGKLIMAKDRTVAEEIKILSKAAGANKEAIVEAEKRLMAEVNEVDFWVKETDRFSMAHLKELIISVELQGNDLVQSISRIGKMLDRPTEEEVTEIVK